MLGSCQATELHTLTRYDVRDLGEAALVTVPKNNSKQSRKFVITDLYYDIYKKYANLRPLSAQPSLFLSFRNGKCNFTQMGINKMGQLGKIIAKFLKLKHPERYTFCSVRNALNNNLYDGEIDDNLGHEEIGWGKAAVASKKKKKEAVKVVENNNKINKNANKIDKSQMIFGSLDSGIVIFSHFVVFALSYFFKNC